MAPGKRRITATRSALGALALLGGAALWWAWPPGGVDAAPSSAPLTAAPEVEAPARWNEPDAALTGEVRRIVRAAIVDAEEGGAKSGACHVSVLVQELGARGALVELDADRPLRPASNLKLATTAVALTLLGAAADFETKFEAGGPLRDGVLRGDLVVRAGGDPLMAEELEGECGPLLAPWVQELRGAGVQMIAGDLVLDLGTFADATPGPAWPSPAQHWKDYCALASGFSANGGCITIKVEPTTPGRPAVVWVHPLGHGANLDVDVLTSAKKSPSNVRPVVFSDRIRVRGTIPADVSSWVGRYAHPDPVGLFGAVLRRALSDGGVEVKGATRRERGTRGGRTLATLRSPIASVLPAINSNSNNAVADQLFYKVGADFSGAGDREGGARATLSALGEYGLDVEGFQQVDGSGLSRENRVTARQMVCLLDAVVDVGDGGAGVFMESLALSGRTGTLADRMIGTPAESRVRGKTGFIGGTSALSGVAMCEGGRFLVFSVLVEYPVLGGLNTNVWKPMQDRICDALVRSG